MKNAHDLVPFLAETRAGAVVGVIGAPRTGKTRSLQWAAKRGAFPRHVVFDPFAMRDRMELKRGREVSPWLGRIVSPRQILMNPELLDRDPLSLVVAPDPMDPPEKIGREFAALGKLVFATGDVDLIAEEAGRYGRNALDVMNLFASGAGHAFSRFFLISQSFGRLHKDVRRNLSALVVFAQGEEDDVKALRTRAGRPFAARVQRLGLKAAPLVWRLGAVEEAA